jgi:hypothetical protein
MTRRLQRLGHDVVSRTVERALNSTAGAAMPQMRTEVLAFHRRTAVVDLLVGSALFRRRFVGREPGSRAAWT